MLIPLYDVALALGSDLPLCNGVIDSMFHLSGTPVSLHLFITIVRQSGNLCYIAFL